MTVYGLKVVNPAGTLVLSSDAFGLYYAGKATAASTATWVDPNSGVETSWGAGGTYQSYKTYTFTSSDACIFAVSADSTHVTSIINVAFSGSVYTITVLCSSGAAGGFGFKTQSATDVYVFKRATSVSSPYGLALYDASGVLAWDLTRMPLFMKEVVTFTLGTTASVAFSGTYTKMGVLGPTMCYQDTPVLTGAGTGTYRMDGQIFGWTISGSNLLRTTDKHRDGPSVVFGAGNSPSGFNDGRLPGKAYLFEANGL